MAHSRVTVPLARKLRLTPTDAELRLWSRLRRRQLESFRFRRQHPLGSYVVDFFCAEAKLIVEVDGGQHADDNDTRTSWLETNGRFWNKAVPGNTEGGLRMIPDAPRSPPPQPPPQGPS